MWINLKIRWLSYKGNDNNFFAAQEKQHWQRDHRLDNQSLKLQWVYYATCVRMDPPWK